MHPHRWMKRLLTILLSLLGAIPGPPMLQVTCKEEAPEEHRESEQRPPFTNPGGRAPHPFGRT